MYFITYKLSYNLSCASWFKIAKIACEISIKFNHNLNNTSADIEGMFFIISGQNFEIPAIVLLTTKIFVYATVNESSREVLPFRPGRDSCEVTGKVTSVKNYRVFQPDLICFEDLGGQLKTTFGQNEGICVFLRFGHLSFINQILKK